MEGCFMFQWGWGVFQMGGRGGFIFKWEGMLHGDGISFDRGTSKKNVGLAEEMLPYAHPTMGNPD